ncbi:MAG: GatB/YqeY domain-containing protein [Firmicutes bacterium]|nr:GatB/YqeY domain-containing protein [Bacillota bacterium]
MLIDQLKLANINALKSKDKEARAAISVVLSKYAMAEIELKSQGKEATDIDLVAILGKVIKELVEEKEGYEHVGNLARVEGIAHQEKILKAFLPSMLSEAEIKAEIDKLADKSIPSIMRHFKANFNGKVDMGLVNKVGRSVQ